MGKLTLVKPQIGLPDATQDPLIINAFTAIEKWANELLGAEGGIESAAIEKGTIEESRLSATLIKRLGEAVTVGEWEKLTLSAKVKDIGFGTPTFRARREVGANIVRLRGSLQVEAGQEIKAHEVVATLPAALRPKLADTIQATVLNAGKIAPEFFEVEPGGGLASESAIKTGSLIMLSGCTFALT